MTCFATVEDLSTLWRALTTEEMERAEALLPMISDALRDEAAKRGKDLDGLISTGLVHPQTAKMVTIGIAVRTMSRDSTGAGTLAQESQSALGYSWSGTYISTGGGLVSILNNDLKQLGLLKQRYGVIDFYAQGD